MNAVNRILITVTLSLFLIPALASGPSSDPFEVLDVERVEIVDLNNLLSPTSITWSGDRFYLTADLMEAKPGIFMLTQSAEGPFQAHPVKLLPQQALEGLTKTADGWLASSQRFFTAYNEDWHNQLLFLEKDQFRLLNRQIVDVGNLCADGTMNCGIVGAVPLPDGRLLVVTRQRLASVHVLKWREGVWSSEFSYPTGMRNKFEDVTEVRLYGQNLCLLFPNRWAIGKLPLDQVLKIQARKRDFEPAFEFIKLRNRFSIKNARLFYDGLAEGFDFDGNGNLWVVVNNRGFSYSQVRAGSFQGRNPKLMIFLKQQPETPPKKP